MIISLLKRSVFFLAAFFIFSCTSKEKQNHTGFTGNAVFSELYLFEPSPLEYILAHCKIYDLKNKSVLSIEGNECAFPKNGDQIIYKRYFLSAFDRNGKKLWVYNNLSLHHQIEFADNEREILAMDWDFWKDKDNVCYRFDRLLVLGRDGKLKKSVSFKELLSDQDKSGLYEKLRVDKESACEKAFKSVKRISRVNVFKSYKTKEKALAGYYTYDMTNSVFYLFDAELRLQKQISFAGRMLQVPEQISDDQFVFYEILRDEQNNTQSAQLMLLNLKDEKPEIFYKSAVNIPNADYCGGLIYRGDFTLAVSHSDCTGGQGGTVDLYIEVLNLSKKTAVDKISVPKTKPYGVQIFNPPPGFWERGSYKKEN